MLEESTCMRTEDLTAAAYVLKSGEQFLQELP